MTTVVTVHTIMTTLHYRTLSYTVHNMITLHYITLQYAYDALYIAIRYIRLHHRAP